MRILPDLSRSTWAFVGTGAVLALLALVGSTAFHRSSSATKRMTVGMDVSETAANTQYELPRQPGALSDPRIELLPQKLIRSAKISLEVKDLPRFEGNCRQLADRFGYLADLRISQDEDGRKRADLTLRIAAERFDAAVAEFKSLGVVKQEELSVEDVTRAYADLEARRANKRTTAARLREIIANRTGKLSDVIEAEQALGQVTEEIESMEAQKRTLDGQISYSTLRADVFEPPLPRKFNAPTLWEPLVGALKDGRSGLIASLAFVLEATIVLSPWILLSTLGIWASRRWRAHRASREEIQEIPGLP
jgi:hypothetical protein